MVSHIAQPEPLTTRICSYVLEGFGEKKKKKKRKRRLATVLSSGANLKKKKNIKKERRVLRINKLNIRQSQE